MEIVVRVAEPKTEEERMITVTARVSPSTNNPTQAHVTLDGKDYLIEDYDR